MSDWPPPPDQLAKQLATPTKKLPPIACETCTFWIAPNADAPEGECHRHAPTIMDRSWNDPAHGFHAETVTEWPRTVRAAWCGDHAFN